LPIPVAKIRIGPGLKHTGARITSQALPQFNAPKPAKSICGNPGAAHITYAIEGPGAVVNARAAPRPMWQDLPRRHRQAGSAQAGNLRRLMLPN
jgi:hypothetical protein